MEDKLVINVAFFSFFVFVYKLNSTVKQTFFNLFFHSPQSPKVCCKDLWYLEVDKPGLAARSALLRASTDSLELCWASTPASQYYHLEVDPKPSPIQPLIQPLNDTSIISTATTTPTIAVATETTTTTSPVKIINRVPIVSVPAPVIIQRPIIVTTTTNTVITPTIHPIQNSTVPSLTLNNTNKLKSPAGQFSGNLRVVTPNTVNSQPIRVLSSGQTVRLTNQTGTILRQENHTLQPVQNQSKTVTLGGNKIILQKPLITLVKTSQGMQLQNLPKVLQKQPVPAGKSSIVTGNVVKLMSPSSVAGNKILMKNSNLVQVGKMGGNVGGKPTFVISNKTGQRTGNQQIIVVTTGSGLRQVQTGSIVTTANNFASFVTSSQVNTMTSAGSTGNAVKMIRGVQGGKPITFTVGLPGNKTGMQQIIHVPQKAMTIDGKSVTVQLAPGSGGQKTVTIVSSSNQIIQNKGGEQSAPQKVFMMQKQRKPDVIDQLDGGNDDLMMDDGQKNESLTIVDVVSPSLPEETAVSLIDEQNDVQIDDQVVDDDFGINEILNVDMETTGAYPIMTTREIVQNDCQTTSTMILADIMDDNIDEDDDNQHRDDILKNDGFIHFDHQFENSIRDDLDAMGQEPKISDDDGDDSSNSTAPSEAEAEAASILTTIKQGEILHATKGDTVE